MNNRKGANLKFQHVCMVLLFLLKYEKFAFKGNFKLLYHLNSEFQKSSEISPHIFLVEVSICMFLL